MEKVDQANESTMDAQGQDDHPNGLPRLEDEFIQRYLSGRSALISQEKQQRADHAFRKSLSAAAIEASAIVARLRDEERRTLWTSKAEEQLAQDLDGDIYPGMMFTLAKDRLEQSKLWSIVKRMPKGALLHAHMDAIVDVGWLLDQMMSTPGIHLISTQALTSSSALEEASIQLRYLKRSDTAGSTIWTANYEPSAPVSVVTAADSFPHGGRPGFLTWLKDRCTITLQESLQHHRGPDAVWRKFASAFVILDSIIYYEPIFRAFVNHMCRQLLEDGVRWVDLRAAFVFEYRREGQEAPESDYLEVMRVLDQEIERFKRSDEGTLFWGARMIWTTVRRFDSRRIVDSMEQCIAVKKVYPHLVAGFDLVGQEDNGRPLKDLTPELFWFRKRCVEEGLEIPFFFHAGEGLGDGDETDENLFDALLLGTRRIGHGFSLFKHPLLIEMVKEKKILIESCPISNEVLRLTSSITAHPLPALLSRGVPVALCNDDPAILGHSVSGVSHDFWQALQGWHNLGLEGLGALAENSVRWAAFEDQSTPEWIHDIKAATMGTGLRASYMKEWAIEWERFCQSVVDEHGQEESGDNDDDDDDEVVLNSTHL